MSGETNTSESAPAASVEAAGDLEQSSPMQETIAAAGSGVDKVTASIDQASGPEAATTAAADAEEAGAATDEAWLGLSRGDQYFLLVCGCTALVLMTLHWGRLSGWGRRPIEIDRLPAHAYDFQIDINTATWVEWMQLDEIGETLARRIVADREEQGPFRSVDELRRVKGIGPKTLETIRPWLQTSEKGGESP